jgi:hypothetical protein
MYSFLLNSIYNITNLFEKSSKIFIKNRKNIKKVIEKSSNFYVIIFDKSDFD